MEEIEQVMIQTGHVKSGVHQERVLDGSPESVLYIFLLGVSLFPVTFYGFGRISVFSFTRGWLYQMVVYALPGTSFSLAGY